MPVSAACQCAHLPCTTLAARSPSFQGRCRMLYGPADRSAANPKPFDQMYFIPPPFALRLRASYLSAVPAVSRPPSSPPAAGRAHPRRVAELTPYVHLIYLCVYRIFVLSKARKRAENLDNAGGGGHPVSSAHCSSKSCRVAANLGSTIMRSSAHVHSARLESLSAVPTARGIPDGVAGAARVATHQAATTRPNCSQWQS